MPWFLDENNAGAACESGVPAHVCALRDGLIDQARAVRVGPAWPYRIQPRDRPGSSFLTEEQQACDCRRPVCDTVHDLEGMGPRYRQLSARCRDRCRAGR